MDACLIAAAQRVEHYEMAAYGTLAAWAKAMGHTEAASLLEETLNEEKAADENLTSLAEGGINKAAASSVHSEKSGGEEDAEAEPATRKARKASAAGKKKTSRK
jgi:hypothetical protein